jgi:hypothetical protein
MDLEELLEVLEDDMIDDILQTLMDLDESGIEASFEIAFEEVEVDEDEEMSGVFLLDLDGNEVDLEGMLEEINGRASSPLRLGNLRFTAEDLKVKQMLEWFDIQSDEDDYI